MFRGGTKIAEGKPQETRKAINMKKSTMEAIRATLVDFGVAETDPIVIELDAELNRGAAEKAARAAEYDGVHDLIIDNLSSVPVTVTDLFNEIETDLPSGFTKGKVQYALNNLWQDEIVKIPGKPNTYRRA